MTIFLTILGYTVLGLIVILILLSILLATVVDRPRVYKNEKVIEIETQRGFIRNYQEMEKTDYLVKSNDGYVLHCTFVPNKGNKFVIISHGYTYSKYDSVKYLHCFYKLGYNVIIYDDRAHGENKKATCTLGFKESKDLICVISDAYKRFGKDIYLGLHGESMGSALQVMALKYKPNVKFIVNDCGFARLDKVLEHKVTSLLHLPKWLVYPASLMSKIFYGYFFSEVQPYKYLIDNKIPICFIHGVNDTFIDKKHSEFMYEIDGGYKELHLFDNADHAESFWVDEPRYVDIVEKFLNKVEQSN